MNKTIWECQNCGAQFPKWTGQCPECQKWNSLVETAVSTNLKTQSSKFKTKTQSSKPQNLSDVLASQANMGQRIGTGIGELDRVLGGGLVPGEVVLLAGEPGMGKSTLLSRVALAVAAGYQSSVFGSRPQVNQFSVSQLKTDKLKTGKPETDLPAEKRAISRERIVREAGEWQAEAGNRQLKTDNRTVLYVCGEESPSQVALRLKRLGDSRLADSDSRLTLLSETNVDSIVAEVERQFSYQSSVVGYRSSVVIPAKAEIYINRFRVKPGMTDENRKHPPVGEAGKTDNRIVIVDSIQTLTTDDLTGVAGSVGQVRESAGRLMAAAKKLNIPIFLVGHVTKDGTVAGPKVLEHMVDAVLVLEGERSGNFRILRAVKNRFGAVDEVGLFAMDNGDMKEVINPGELLLGGAAGRVPGSVLGCTLEGLRPLILEVQALAVPSKLAVPRRVGQGISERKLQVLCAVIERYVNRKLGDMDIFVSIAGGLKSSDPGLDLAVVGAVISSIKERVDDRRLKIEDSGRESKVEDRNNRADQSTFYPLSSTTTLHLPSSTVSAVNSIFCGEVGLLGEVRQVQGWERREKEVKRLGAGQLVGANKIRNIRELSLSFLA